MNTGQVTATDVQDALVFIRDNIITDETVETFFGAVDKMTSLFTQIYFAFKKLNDKGAIDTVNNIQRELIDAGYEGYIDPLIRAIREGEQDIELTEILETVITHEDNGQATASRSVSFEGILKAIMALIGYINTTGSILKDVHTVVESVSKIKHFSAVSKGSEDIRSRQIVSDIGEDLLPIYKQFAE